MVKKKINSSSSSSSFIYHFLSFFCLFLTLNESSCNASNYLSGINKVFLILNHILCSQLSIFKVNQVDSMVDRCHIYMSGWWLL